MGADHSRLPHPVNLIVIQTIITKSIQLRCQLEDPGHDNRMLHQIPLGITFSIFSPEKTMRSVDKDESVKKNLYQL